MVSVVRLLLAVVALASCGRPGVVVERCNGTLEPVVVREAYNDASETSERLAPGSRGEFGPAVSWHVSLSGTLVEVQHPGDGFAESRPFGQQLPLPSRAPWVSLRSSPGATLAGDCASAATSRLSPRRAGRVHPAPGRQVGRAPPNKASVDGHGRRCAAASAGGADPG
jgi:hypothetical protein